MDRRSGWFNPPAAAQQPAAAQRYAPVWSPDSKKIVFGDKDGKVYVVTVATKQIQMIADA
ncbi:MAG: hypothetical protein IPK98_03220 [Chloracidobacterium sp.]|nr:hypothetical protein [Chloracidobacterium sp.]